MPVNANESAALLDLAKSFTSSFEQRDRLSAALREHLGVTPRDSFYVSDDGTDDVLGPVVIYRIDRDCCDANGCGTGMVKGLADEPFFRVTYARLGDGYTFGEPVKVRRVTAYEAVRDSDACEGLDAGQDEAEVPEWLAGALARAASLTKGAGHRYIRRVPKSGGGYRYFYKVSGGGGLGHEDEMKVGAKFRVANGGKEGHFEIVGKDDKGNLRIKHDESGHESSVSPAALRSMLHAEHAQSLTAHREKLAADIKATDDPKAKAKLLAEAGKYEHTRDLAEPAPSDEEYESYTQMAGSKAADARWNATGDRERAAENRAQGNEAAARAFDVAAAHADREAAAHSDLDMAGAQKHAAAYKAASDAAWGLDKRPINNIPGGFFRPEPAAPTNHLSSLKAGDIVRPHTPAGEPYGDTWAVQGRLADGRITIRNPEKGLTMVIDPTKPTDIRKIEGQEKPATPGDHTKLYNWGSTYEHPTARATQTAARTMTVGDRDYQLVPQPRPGKAPGFVANASMPGRAGSLDAKGNMTAEAPHVFDTAAEAHAAVVKHEAAQGAKLGSGLNEPRKGAVKAAEHEAQRAAHMKAAESLSGATIGSPDHKASVEHRDAARLHAAAAREWNGPYSAGTPEAASAKANAATKAITSPTPEKSGAKAKERDRSAAQAAGADAPKSITLNRYGAKSDHEVKHSAGQYHVIEQPPEASTKGRLKHFPGHYSVVEAGPDGQADVRRRTSHLTADEARSLANDLNISHPGGFDSSGGDVGKMNNYVARQQKAATASASKLPKPVIKESAAKPETRKSMSTVTDPERDLAKSLAASHRTAAMAQPDAGAKDAHEAAAQACDAAATADSTGDFRRALGAAERIGGLIKAWSGIPADQRRDFGAFAKSMQSPGGRLGYLPFQASNGTGDALGQMGRAFENARPPAEQLVQVAPEPTTYSPQRGAVNGMRKSMGSFYDRLSAGAAQQAVHGIRCPPEAPLAKSGGPFIGPHGGKWADAAHKVPWHDPAVTGRQAQVIKDHRSRAANMEWQAATTRPGNDANKQARIAAAKALHHSANLMEQHAKSGQPGGWPSHVQEAMAAANDAHKATWHLADSPEAKV